MNILVLVAVLPSILLGWYIYKNDTQEKESAKLLTTLFIGGVLAIPLTLFIEFIMDFFTSVSGETGNIAETFIYAFIYVALAEEFSKLFFLKLYSWKNPEFDYLYDGLIYAAFVALGFATIENLLYVSQLGFATAIVRAITAVPGHFFDGIFMGYFYSKAKEAQVLNNKKMSYSYMVLSLFIPLVLHGLYDFLCFMGTDVFMIVFFIFVIILYIVSFRLIKKLSLITTDITGYNRKYNNRFYTIINGKNSSQNTAISNGVILNNQIQPIVNNTQIINNQNGNSEVNNYCPNCGFKISGANFCANCGTKIN